MKSNIALLLAFLATAVCGLRAQSPVDAGDISERGEKIRYQLILPEEKAPETVKPSEPNPFSKADNHAIKEDGASGEENRVREILSSLPITGFVDDSRTGGTEGARVLLGPMKLKRGDYVPKVLAEQTVQLRVNSITRQQIDLIWVEKKVHNTGLAPRVVTLPVRVAPKVRIALPSLPTPTHKQGGTIYQNDRSMQGTGDTPPETRKAVAADDSKTPPASASPPSPKSDPEHPANVLMNYLFKSANKVVDAPPPPAESK